MNAPSPDAPARILVVDDTEANRDLLVRRLERDGHATATAENGRIALEILHREAFDLVLLDVMMPEMDGFEMMAQLKADDALKHVPVILISALGDTENVAKGIELGADDFLPKPFNRHILKARVGASLAKKRLHDREQLYARSLEREMDIARSIQAGFLPRRLPKIPGWDFACRFEPARSVAGDFYDAFALAGGQRIALVVADVCGKGVGAALFMAVSRSLLRALSERMLTAGGDMAREVPLLIDAVNDYIARTHERANMFATLFFGVLDVNSGAFTYVNAGHEPPVIVGAAGIRASLAPTGPAVGMLPGLPFASADVIIDADESIVIYTDGVTDARDAAGAMFTEQRLMQVLADPGQSADTLVGKVEAALQAHTQGVEAFDDVTLLVAHRALAGC